MKKSRDPRGAPREHGTVALMALGMIALMLVFASLAVNAAQYYSLRTKLQTVASQASNYGATYLPNYDLAVQRAYDFLMANSKNFRTDEPEWEGLDAQFYVDYYDHSTSNPQLKRLNVTGSVNSSDPPVGQGYEGFQLPIKSITVKLEATKSFALMNLAGGDYGSVGHMTARAEATAQLVPTDVVLVVDNSNSAVSGGAWSDSAYHYNGFDIGTGSNGIYHPFAMWNEFMGKRHTQLTHMGPTPNYNDAAGMSYLGGLGDGAYTSAQIPIQKGYTKVQQCFGNTTLMLKSGALALFDLLTSSASFRVGVVHTLNPGGEFPMPSINITSNSYKYIYTRNTDFIEPSTEEPAKSEIFFIDKPNATFGATDYDESACAALTDIEINNNQPEGAVSPIWTAFPVPIHPLEGLFSNLAGYWRSNTFVPNLRPLLKCNGVYNSAECLTPGSHLAWDPDDSDPSPPAEQKGLLARDLIWTKIAGRAYGSGYMNPKYDYANMEFSIRRAIDMLRTAPKREDSMPVRRKVVLVITDGFETGVKHTGVYSKMEDMEFHFINESAVKNSPNFSPPEEIDYDSPAEEYCGDAAITGLTDVGSSLLENQQGVKLGVLYYGYRDGGGTHSAWPYYPGHDPVRVVRALHGHEHWAPALRDIRDACNTKWSATRGRFWVESSHFHPMLTFTELSDSPWSYYTLLAPRVARSLFAAEVLDSRRDL